MNLGQLIVSHDGIVLAASDPALDLLGLDGNKVVGCPIEQVWTEARVSSFEAVLALKEIAGGVSRQREGMLIRSDDGEQRGSLGWQASRLLHGAALPQAVLLLWNEIGRSGDTMQPLNS